MGEDEVLSSVKAEVEKAVELIKKKHTGANIEEAKGFLKRVGDTLNKDDFRAAMELARSAQLAAKPTTEYLLGKAKKLASNGEEHFNRKGYEDAIGTWGEALAEYERALELAKERGEKEFVEALDRTIRDIKGNIANAEVARDNAAMLSLVEKANTGIRNGDALFDEEKYDDAKVKYEEARESLRSALSTAKKSGFEKDRKKIEGSLKSIEDSIEACMLEKGRFLIKDAGSGFQSSDFDAAEKGFEGALSYLESLKVSKEAELEELKRDAQRGLIKARIGKAKGVMKEAEELNKKKETYEAKEKMRAAKEYLASLSTQAVNFEVLEEKSEIDRLIEHCIENIRILTDALLGTVKVKAEITPLIEIAEAKSRFGIKEREMASPKEVLKERYAFLGLIGVGNFAEVWRARRKKTNEVVALKIMKSALDEKARASFMTEVETWAKLEHETIVKRKHWDFSPPYIEMELATDSLDKLKKPVEVEKACKIIFEVCRALNHAHKKGITHRDIKPGNILFFGEKVKVSDWGLAKISGQSSEWSLGGFKSIYYAAPEQFKRGEIDERTDIYQLGAVFYELVTGRRPFEGEAEAEIMEQVLSLSPKPPSSINPKLENLDGIILKCLEKEKAKRYQSARELQLAIAEFLENEYKVRMELSKGEAGTRWLSELLLMQLKLKNTKESLNYARRLFEETKDGEVEKIRDSLKFRLEKDIEIADDFVAEAELALRRLM